MIQVFGTKKCHDTQKALRFFKERNIKIQFVNLEEKAFSKGELDSISHNIPLDDLLDTSSKEYKRLNLAYMTFDLYETLLENPLLFKTPITRFGKEAKLGVRPETWKKWIEAY